MNEEDENKPKLTPEMAFAILCVSMAIFFIFLVLYALPSMIEKYLSVMESPHSSQPLRRPK